jgi:hypothetical protein
MAKTLTVAISVLFLVFSDNIHACESESEQIQVANILYNNEDIMESVCADESSCSLEEMLSRLVFQSITFPDKLFKVCLVDPLGSPKNKYTGVLTKTDQDFTLQFVILNTNISIIKTSPVTLEVGLLTDNATQSYAIERYEIERYVLPKNVTPHKAKSIKIEHEINIDNKCHFKMSAPEGGMTSILTWQKADKMYYQSIFPSGVFNPRTRYSFFTRVNYNCVPVGTFARGIPGKDNSNFYQLRGKGWKGEGERREQTYDDGKLYSFGFCLRNNNLTLCGNVFHVGEKSRNLPKESVLPQVIKMLESIEFITP